jgi:hypothetical protein
MAGLFFVAFGSIFVDNTLGALFKNQVSFLKFLPRNLY